MKIIIGSKGKHISKIFKLGVILMVTTSMLGLLGCSKENEKNEKTPEAQTAEKLLQEKYNEEFVTYSMGGRWGTLTNDTFSVTCSPKNNPDLKFDAEISKDGSYMFDEYVSRRVSDLIEKSLTKSFSSKYKYFVIKAGAGTKTINSDNSNMSIEEFLKTNKGGGYAIEIIIDKESLSGVSGATLYDNLNSMLCSIPKLDGAIEIYFVESDVLQKTITYLKQCANIDSGFEELLENSNSVFVGIKDGVLEMSSDEFEAKFK